MCRLTLLPPHCCRNQKEETALAPGMRDGDGEGA